jgi:hypothetical protein
METNKSELTRRSAEERSDGIVANQLELELASGYAANSKLSLEIIEDFAAVDQEGFQRRFSSSKPLAE